MVSLVTTAGHGYPPPSSGSMSSQESQPPPSAQSSPTSPPKVVISPTYMERHLPQTSSGAQLRPPSLSAHMRRHSDEASRRPQIPLPEIFRPESQDQRPSGGTPRGVREYRSASASHSPRSPKSPFLPSIPLPLAPPPLHPSQTIPAAARFVAPPPPPQLPSRTFPPSSRTLRDQWPPNEADPSTQWQRDSGQQRQRTRSIPRDSTGVYGPRGTSESNQPSQQHHPSRRVSPPSYHREQWISGEGGPPAQSPPRFQGKGRLRAQSIPYDDTGGYHEARRSSTDPRQRQERRGGGGDSRPGPGPRLETFDSYNQDRAASGSRPYTAGWSPRGSQIAPALSPSDSPLVEHIRGAPRSLYMAGSRAAASVSNFSSSTSFTKNVLVKKSRPSLPRAKSTSDLLAHGVLDRGTNRRH